jgi:hypothetical protein
MTLVYRRAAARSSKTHAIFMASHYSVAARALRHSRRRVDATHRRRRWGVEMRSPRDTFHTCPAASWTQNLSAFAATRLVSLSHCVPLCWGQRWGQAHGSTMGRGWPVARSCGGGVMSHLYSGASVLFCEDIRYVVPHSRSEAARCDGRVATVYVRRSLLLSHRIRFQVPSRACARTCTPLWVCCQRIAC